MTYREIVSFAARKVGYRAFEEALMSDLEFAVKQALDELQSKTGIVRATETVNIGSGLSKYYLPADFASPREFTVYDNNGTQLAHVDVPYAQWQRWNPEAETATSQFENEMLKHDVSARAVQEHFSLKSRVVLSVDYQEGDYWLFVKPSVDGTVEVYYTPELHSLKKVLHKEPPIPKEFHRYLIPGTVLYLAEIESAKPSNRDSEASLIFYRNLINSSRNELRDVIDTVTEKSEPQTQATIVRAFTWYESGSEYR